jgi:hypothetical protein
MVGLGTAFGLSIAVSSINFWKSHSEGLRFIADTATPPEEEEADVGSGGADDGQKVSGMSSTENVLSMDGFNNKGEKVGFR